MVDVGRVRWGPAARHTVTLKGSGHNTAFPAVSIDDSGEFIGQSFLAPKSGTINRCGVRVMAVNGSCPDMNIGITGRNASGIPDGTPAGGSAAQLFSPAAGWQWVTLGTPAVVTAGDILYVQLWEGGTPPSGANNLTVAWDEMFDEPNTVDRLDMAYRFLGFGSWNYSPVPVAYSYNDGSVYGFACTNYADEIFDSADTPDEVGCRFVVPFDCTCVGILAHLGAVTANGAFEARLYNSIDTVLATWTCTDTDKIFTRGLKSFPIAPVDLTALATYRVTIRSTHASATLVVSGLKFNAAGDQAHVFQDGGNWDKTERTDLGAWTNTTDEVAMMGIVLSDIAAGGAAGAKWL